MRDSFLRTLGGDADTVPMFLRDMTLCMDLADVDTTAVISEGRFDAELSARCIASFAEFTGQDAVIGCCHSPAFIIEQFGGRMKYPVRGITAPLTHPLSGMTDFSGLDPEPKGMALEAIRSYSLVKRMTDAAVVANVTGPLTKAGVLAGIENVSMMTQSDPDVLNGLISFCLENTECVVERMDADESIDAGLLAAATDNPDLFGDDVFREVCVPWTRRFCRTFLERGLPCIWHPHGDMFSEGRDLGPEVIDTGCTCFHFAEGCDLAVLRRSLGGRVPLMGGTDIVPTLMTGDTEAVVSETERFLFSLEGVPYVFSASCSLHRGVPLRGVKAMTDAVRQLNSGRV